MDRPYTHRPFHKKAGIFFRLPEWILKRSVPHILNMDSETLEWDENENFPVIFPLGKSLAIKFF